MAELRLVGVSEDGSHLVLTDDHGTEHTIVIDERLRAGVHGHLSRLGQLTMALESRISPRDIQNKVRSGESAEHVAQTAGVPLERVLRFLGPVLREREHVADQARQARLAGSSGPSAVLSDLVAKAAERQGIDADDVEWDSARRDDHTWVVITRWPDDSTATWALDLSRHQATAVDLAARRISGLIDGATTPNHSGGRDFPDMAGSPAFARFDADDPDDTATVSDDSTRPEATVHQFVPRGPGGNDTASDVDAAVPTAVATAEAPTAEDPAADAPTADDEAPVTSAQRGAAPEPTPSEPLPHAGPARTARRAKVPRWDDIMFGMKPKDGS
jgi:Protein of unknown function (DUF3071)